MAIRDNNEQDTPVASAQIPRATLQALNQLSRQIESLNDYLIAQKAPTAQSRIQSELQAVANRQHTAQPSTKMPPVVQKIQEAAASLPGQISPMASVPVERESVESPTPEPYVARPGEVSFRKRLQEGKQNISEGRRGTGFNQFSKGFLNPKIEKSSINNKEIPQGAFPPGSSRTPSSIIPGMSEEEVNVLRNDNLKIPEFGDWQLDTKLQLARDFAARIAMGGKGKYDEEGNFEFGSPARQAASTVSGYLNYAHSQAANLYAARHGFDRIMNFGGNFEAMGKQLGYNPQSGWGPSSIFGFRNPLAPYTSEAGQQGMGMRWDAEKMARFGTGVTSSQAQEIYAAGASKGFSNQQGNTLGLTTGGDLENISTQLIAPIVKNTGMSPEVAWGFADALRNGNTSIKQLSETLKNLPEAAHAARETINELGESVIGFAQEAEQYGATKQQGYQTGLGITQSTGLDPRIIGQQMSNPLFQGMALTHLGVLPSALGTLSGGTLSNLSLQALKMTMSATHGLATPKYETIGGHKIEVDSGEEAQIAQAAQLAGIPPEIAMRMWRERHKYEAAAHTNTLLTAETSSGWKTDYASSMQRAKKYQGGKLSKYQEYILEHGGEEEGHYHVGWDQISQELHKAGATKSEIAKIAKEKFGERAGSAENLLTKLTKQQIGEEGQNPVQVKFTGLAAKFFEQVPISSAKASSNAGGPSITSYATSALQAITNPISLLGVPTPDSLMSKGIGDITGVF